MNIIAAIQIIKQKFERSGGEAEIHKMKGGYFKAKLVEGGIEVDNLGNLPFLPWAVFQEAICLLIRNNGRAARGDAMVARLGEPELTTETIEGHVAQAVYGKQAGESVFRRITPISCILVWSELCEYEKGTLILRGGTPYDKREDIVIEAGQNSGGKLETEVKAEKFTKIRLQQSQIAELTGYLQDRHGAKYENLKTLGLKFANFLRELPGFNQCLGATDPVFEVQHVGRVIVDGVLQVGHDFEKQVRKRVERICEYPEAATVSGFRNLLESQGIVRLLDFDSKDTEKDLIDVSLFFASRGIETYSELWEWLKSETNRDILLSINSGLGQETNTPFRISDKTADYFRLIVCHWDAVAVDKGVKMLLADSGIVSLHSTKFKYKEKRTIVQLAALELNYRPLDLDQSIYRFYISRGQNKPKKTPNNPKASSKSCIECGEKIPRRSKYCPDCGVRQI